MHLPGKAVEAVEEVEDEGEIEADNGNTEVRDVYFPVSDGEQNGED